VSEKTGYPTEMLDLGMDMEADLGIDSIKRVEILGALQERFPDLPKPNPEELVEIDLRTLGQILDYMQSLAPTSVPTEREIPTASNSEVQVAPIASGEAAIKQEPKREIDDFDLSVPVATPKPGAVPPEIAEAPGLAADIDFSALSDSLLEVVSEKTGYPTEMLEMDMDMEADLGIDSIKRVEILGALQERFPDLPKPNPEELIEVELLTLGQIVDYMKSLAPTHEKKKFLAPSKPSHNIVRAPVRLRFLPEPDFLESSFPEGSLGVLTDDGSELTSQIAHALAAKGWKLIVLSFPSVSSRPIVPEGTHRVVLQDLSEEHLQEQVTALTAQLEGISAFIHVHPLSPETEQEETVLRGVFFLAKHLKDSLNQAAEKRRTCFFTVARLDGAFGLEQQTDFTPLSGGLFGLTKALNREWESVFCRAIDLSPTLDAATAAQRIFAELHDPNRLIAEVAYGPQGRTTLVC
jgi:acyl carrier protein